MPCPVLTVRVPAGGSQDDLAAVPVAAQIAADQQAMNVSAGFP